VEAGIDLTPVPGVTLGATAFYNRLGNAIANITTGTNLRKRQNVKAIIAKGVELTANARHGDMMLSASYAYSHSVVDAPGQGFDGLTPSQSPRHSASGTVMWAPQRGPALSATVRYVSRQFEDDLQTDALPGAVTLDATASLPLGHGIALMVRGENITDKTVITRNSGGSLDIGKPRTLWVGVKIAR
jgi:iron complex outermembrane receptor protein